MGRLADDRIPPATHLAGVISLPSSILTLGGLQHLVPALSRTITADVVLAANTLYFVYVQLVSNAPAMRISASVPSAYKAINPTANLVAAFYATANVTPVFGTFLSITGVPQTETEFFCGKVSTNIDATTTPPSIGTATITVDNIWASRLGGRVFYRFEFVTTAAGTATAGSGDYKFGCPFPANLQTITPFTGVIGNGAIWRPSNIIGRYGASYGSSQHQGVVVCYDANYVRMLGSTHGAASSNSAAGAISSASGALSTQPTYAATFDFVAANWTNQQLKDL